MTIATQAYADLCDDSYRDRPAGVRPPDDAERVIADGHAYRIREHTSNPRTGYQGTIYQNVETGEIVVAHRGTEFDKLKTDPVEFNRDVTQADGGMVFERANLQTPDAMALTRKAIEYAEREGRKPGNHYVAPTVTGHSLGGNLAQITSHYFGLHGETFNPYGAVSLNLRIGEGGNLVTNYVMAGDPVSAAGPQFGRVVAYTKLEELQVLRATHADQSPANSAVAAGMLVGDSHRLYNFLNNDNGKPHVSVLSDPHAQALAQQHEPLIARYRGNIDGMRTDLSLIGPLPSNLEHGINMLRGPIQPGTPYREEREQAREQAERVARSAAMQERLQSMEERRIDPPWMQGLNSGIRVSERSDQAPPMLKRADAHAGQDATPLYGHLSPYGSQPPGLHETSRGQAQLQFPPGHRDHALFEAICAQLPEGTSEAKAAEVTLRAKMGGIREPGQIKDVVIQDDRVFVMGNRLGMRADADLSTPAPPLQDTLRQSEHFDKQQAQELGQFQVMQQQIQAQGQGGPSLSL